ncbi:MAG: glycosyltransferase, partial [Lachnospiraceae bacterium]|nr:glycosyltransferase [Lachnospiraceae bacterium]
MIFELMKDNEVILSMPFVGHEEDFKQKGLRCIETKIDRRGINPLTDLNLLRTYRKILKKELPDLVITYSIKPNIYAGWLCGQMGIPFCANVQGL